VSSFLGGFLGGLGGGAIGSATVDLLLNSKQYTEQLAASEAQTAEASAGMGAETKAASGTMTAAYAAAGLAAVEFAKSSVAAAIEQEEATAKLNNAIANSPKVSFEAKAAFDQQATSIMKLTGVGDEQVTTGQALLVQMGLTADQITQLTPLVVDLATKNGIDLQAAFKAVGKAAEGNTGALARYVGTVEKGKNPTETFANVVEKLGAVQGYAAQQANAEPWRKLEAAFNEIQETVGNKIIPVLADAADLLNTIANKELPSFTSATDLAKRATDAAALGIRALSFGSLDLVPNMQKGADSVGELQQQLDTLDASLKAGAISGPEYVNQVRALGEAHHLTAEQVDQLAAAAETNAGAQTQQAAAAEHAAKQQRNAADAAREQKKAERELAGQLNVTSDVLDQFAGKAHVSATNVVKAFDRSLRAAQTYGDNLDTLRHRRIPQGLLDDLAQLGTDGAGLVEALANSNKQQFDRIVSDWRKSGAEARDQAHTIDGAFGPLQRKGYKIPVTIDVAVAWAGGVPPQIMEDIRRQLNISATHNGGNNGLVSSHQV